MYRKDPEWAIFSDFSPPTSEEEPGTTVSATSNFPENKVRLNVQLKNTFIKFMMYVDSQVTISKPYNLIPRGAPTKNQGPIS